MKTEYTVPHQHRYNVSTVLILVLFYVPVNSFQSCWDDYLSSWVEQLVTSTKQVKMFRDIMGCGKIGQLHNSPDPLKSPLLSKPLLVWILEDFL